jgi:hypothetical protein
MVPLCQEFSGRGNGDGGSGQVEHQGAFIVEADFRWDSVGADDVFGENR